VWLVDEDTLKDRIATDEEEPETEVTEPAGGPAPAGGGGGPRRRRRRRGGSRQHPELPGNRGKHLADE
jgi:hypothetical protein